LGLEKINYGLQRRTNMVQLIYSVPRTLKVLRDDASFENWYRTGKFGATPNIKEINFLYDNE